MPVAHQREKVLALIQAHANSRGWVDLDIVTIAEQTGIPAHDVTKSLWGLQKQALVSFRERKLGNGTNGRTKSALSRIRLTHRGRTITPNEVAHLPDEQVEPTTTPSVDPPAPPEAGAQRPESRSGASLLGDFPLISALLERRARLEQAAAILSLADADELALAALERIEETTPFEQEVLRLINALQLHNPR